MKLHKVFGAVAVLAITALSATSVFAADSIELGKPIDLTTNETATELTAGKAIAIPFNFVSDTTTATSVELKVDYDNTALSAGVTYSELSATEQTNVDVLDDTDGDGGNFVNDSYGKLAAVILTKAPNAKGVLKYMGAGSFIANSAYADNSTYITGATSSAFSVAGDVDGYFFFKVIKAPESLNAELAAIDGAASLIADASNDKAPVYDNTTNTTEAKSNSCAGAFKIVLDEEKLSAAKMYVSALTVKVGSKEEDVFEYVKNGEYIFEFPVRLNGTGSTVDVQVIADVSATEGGEVSKVEIANFTASLDNPTDYTSPTISYAK